MSLTPRLLFAATALACAGLLAYGYYLQYHDGLEPCPMCIFQRLCFMGVLVVCALGAIHGPRGAGRLVYGGLTVLVALVGGGIATRQVWLQHLPEDRVPACGPGLEYMLEMYPLADVIRKALRGSGDCGSTARLREAGALSACVRRSPTTETARPDWSGGGAPGGAAVAA